MHILFVDHSERRSTVADHFVGSGTSVEFSRDREEALHLALTRNYDVILLELCLPHISGIEIVRCLRIAGVLTPIMILTERDDVRERVEALNAGADDSQSKAISFDELLPRIERLARRG